MPSLGVRSLCVGLSRKGNKKRPDGLTYTTWKNRKGLNLGFHLCGHFMQMVCQESLYRSGLCSSRQGRQSGKIQQFDRLLQFFAHWCQDIWCLWSSRHQQNLADWQKMSAGAPLKKPTLDYVQMK